MEEDATTAGLSFLETIVLLGLDDKGWFANSEHRIKYGMAGAILFELYTAGRIGVDETTLRVVDPKETGDAVLDKVLEFLQTGKKQRSLKSWIQRMVMKKLMIRKTVIRSLIEKKILRKEEYSLLWVMYQYKYPLVNHALKQKLRQEIADMILSGKTLSPKEVMLVSTLDNCRMIRKNFHTMEHYQKLRRQVKEILALTPVPEEPALLFVAKVHSAVSRSIAASNVSVHA